MTAYLAFNHAVRVVADHLRTEARRMEDEAALAEERADYPERFADELLVAVLELAWRIGWRMRDGGDPRRGFHQRGLAAEWLRECIEGSEVETERDRLQVVLVAALLTELEKKP